MFVEIEIRESRGRISRHTYLTPTDIARKMDVPDPLVTGCITWLRVPIEIGKNQYNGQSERRIGADRILGIVDCLTRRRPGNYPDLEQRIKRDEGVIIEVNPAQRPQNLSKVRRGRQYFTRVITFIT